MGSHSRLRSTVSLVRRQLALGVDLVLEPGYKAAPGRPRDLAAVVAGGARQSTDTCDLATDERIRRRHGYDGTTGNRGSADAGEMRRRPTGPPPVK